jgi:hypothetical protein
MARPEGDIGLSPFSLKMSHKVSIALWSAAVVLSLGVFGVMVLGKSYERREPSDGSDSALLTSSSTVFSDWSCLFTGDSYCFCIMMDRQMGRETDRQTGKYILIVMMSKKVR